ncbi:hypothetical protein NST83_01185 [Paenibacillus sp. FSL R10-2782]|uniref:phage adaptor protein n=1 Tax=Paenibacillus sp. FSL R10-2782 TaxID=2954661 RepID=UPI00315819E9
MILQEILDEIAEKYPHGLPSSSVLRKLNTLQQELFRLYFRVNTMIRYEVVTGVFAYPMPAKRSNIIDVVVGEREYVYYAVKGQADCPFYYITESDELGIYPTPDEDGTMIISYYKEPTLLVEADLKVVPDLDSDYHMLLVYGTLAQICEGFNDVDMVNNYTAKFNGLLEDFKRVIHETPDYPVIENVMGRYLL